MHFQTIPQFAILLLSSFALAIPASPPNTPIALPPLSHFLAGIASPNVTKIGPFGPPPSARLAKRVTNLICTDYTAIDQTTTGSPTVNDCLQIMYNIQGGGEWETEAINIDTLVSYGTCNFGVQKDSMNIEPFSVGNGDIITLMYVSIESWQWYGLVGSAGTMECYTDGVGGDQEVWWGVY